MKFGALGLLVEERPTQRERRCHKRRLFCGVVCDNIKYGYLGESTRRSQTTGVELECIMES